MSIPLGIVRGVYAEPPSYHTLIAMHENLETLKLEYGIARNFRGIQFSRFPRMTIEPPKLIHEIKSTRCGHTSLLERSPAAIDRLHTSAVCCCCRTSSTGLHTGLFLLSGNVTLMLMLVSLYGTCMYTELLI